MEPSGKSDDRSRRRKGLGRCRHFFWLGVVFDTVGVSVLFTGVFANLHYCDLLLYLGSIIIFLSLLWWIFWYSGNIELTPKEAVGRPFHVPSASVVNVHNQTFHNRFFFSFCEISTPFREFGQGQRRQRLSQSSTSLSMTVFGQVDQDLAKGDQVDQDLAKGDQDRDGMESVNQRSNAEDFGSEDLGSKPVVQSAEGVCTPGPQAGLPRFVVGAWAPLVPPEFTPSPRDQPLPPAIHTSVVSLASVSQPSVTLASTSLPAVPWSTADLPLDNLASKSQTSAPMVSQSVPLEPGASQNHLLVPVASQSHPLVPVAAKIRFQIPVASDSNVQNLSLTSQTQPQSVQASQTQTVFTPASLIQLLSPSSFQTQPVDQRATPAVQDLQVPCDTQQHPQSSALVQEAPLSLCSLAQEIVKKSIAQASKTVSPTGQELTQEVPDTMSLLHESLTPATEAQQSVSPDSAFTAPSEKDSHPG